MKCPKCSSDLPDRAKFCPYCGPINGQEVNGGMHDSVAIRSPGAGSVYAPQTHIDIAPKGEEKLYCPICRNEIHGDRELDMCGHCGKTLCNKCGEKNRKRAGNITIPKKHHDDFYEPMCWECWRKLKQILNEEQNMLEEERRLAEERIKVKPTSEETSNMEVMCPACGTSMSANDVMCYACGTQLTKKEAQAEEEGTSDGDEEIACPSCGVMICSDAVMCYACGSKNTPTRWSCQSCGEKNRMPNVVCHQCGKKRPKKRVI